MKIDGSHGRVGPLSGSRSMEGAGVPPEVTQFANEVFESGVKPLAQALLEMPPSTRSAVQEGLGQLADRAETSLKSRVASGAIPIDVFNPLAMIYSLCQIVSQQNDAQLSNLAGATTDLNQLTDLNRQITDSGGKIYRDQIGKYSSGSQSDSGMQNTIVQNYQAFTADLQQQLSMFTSGASSVSSAASALQQNTSSIVQLFQGLAQAVSQSMAGFMRSGQ
jgi:hypothetical protein